MWALHQYTSSLHIKTMKHWEIKLSCKKVLVGELGKIFIFLTLSEQRLVLKEQTPEVLCVGLWNAYWLIPRLIYPALSYQWWGTIIFGSTLSFINFLWIEVNIYFDMKWMTFRWLLFFSKFEILHLLNCFSSSCFLSLSNLSNFNVADLILPCLLSWHPGY